MELPWIRVAAIVAVFLHCGAAWSQGKTLLPLYTLTEGAPSNAAISRFIQEGVAWGSPAIHEVRLTSAGTAAPHGGGVSDLGQLSCHCEPPSNFRVSGGIIGYECQYHCRAHQTGNADQSKFSPREISNTWTKFRIAPLFVSNDALLYSDENGDRWLVTDCVSVRDEPGVSRRCASKKMGSHWFLVELIPGSDDPTLLAKVRSFLREDLSETLRMRSVLVEGPRAQKPRSESQVFYAVNNGSSEDEAKRRAQEVASALKEIVGPVDVSKWPGAWKYDVILVVGTRQRAQPPPPSP